MDTQSRKGKESKQINIANHEITQRASHKEQEKKEQKNCKTVRKQQNGNSKSKHVNSYFQYKWIQFSSKKA